ncbi:MAG: hypothetical protein ACQEQ0_05125 [Bacteroidota bacterium]
MKNLKLLFIFLCIVGCKESEDDLDKKIMFQELEFKDFNQTKFYKSLEVAGLENRDSALIGQNINVKTAYGNIYIYNSDKGKLKTFDFS